MQNNKLIAEFMGLQFSKGEYYRPLYNSGDWIPENELQYHTSWDWLMLVVERINTMDDFRYSVAINHLYTAIHDNFTRQWVADRDGYSTLEATYKAVVEFIKEHNKYICGSCGDHVNEVVFNEDTCVDECKNCTI